MAAPKIEKLLTPYNFTNKDNAGRIKYIVIHYVGALGGAEANCKYYASKYLGASAHYFVGFNGEVWQSGEDEDIAWTCGASSYKHAECRNSNSIGIEMCVRNKGSQSAESKDWYFEEATVNAAIELTKYLMQKYGVPASNVIRHHDVTGKICPNPYVYNSTKHTWDAFKKAISGGTEQKDSMTKITGKSEATAEQMTAYIKSNEGYVLLIDFSKFFDNIVHDGLIKEMRKKIGDKETMSFIEKLIDTFRVDVSYMTDEEYANCMKTLYNALEHAQIDKAKLTGEKYMRKSVGIGSQISQISGVYYPTRIDNYCKIVKGMKYYGRYMDDIYIIHEDKEYLKGLLNDIQGICDELGLFINPKKTQIVKLSHGFTFLKIKYNLTETGKVQERISKDSVTRMRRKLKKFRKLMDAGEMSFDDVRCAYASWKGGVSHYDSYNVVKSMDKLFDELFIHPFIGGGHRDEQNNNEQK